MGKYDFNFDLYEDSTLAWIAQKIQPETTVLEFGAANGRLTKFLSEQKHCSVDIVEIDFESGKEAALYASHSWIGKEDGDIGKYIWLNTTQKYDYIVFADVLEHLSNPADVLEHCKFVLKENGELLVSIPNISHNSIIIELMNDRFNYNSIGLLDNTHVKFFTRQSFIQMVEKIGWVVVDERAKYIRVGENEIKNTYHDVPKEVFKELISRDNGEVYQYMFSLAKSEKYLTGNCSRKVNFAPTLYYFLKVQYEHDGIYDYKKEVSQYVDPHCGYLRTKIDILSESRQCLLQFLNCNCITGKPIIKVRSSEWRTIENYADNADIKDDSYFFFSKTPEIIIELQKEDIELEIDIPIYMYDMDNRMLDVYLHLVNAFKLSNSIYEKEIAQKDREFHESARIYENMIQQKDNEFKNSVEVYENILKQKDNEYKQILASHKKKLANNPVYVSLLSRFKKK